MNSVFSRSSAAALAAALLATLPLASPATPSAAVLAVDWSLTPQKIAASCATSSAAVKRRVDAIVRARSRRTFATVVLPLETASADFNDDLAAQAFLYNVSTDPSVRKASLKCSTDAGNVLSELAARPDLYRALAEAQKSGTAQGTAQRKLTQLWLTALKRSGAGLPDAQRREFVALQQKLTDLQNKFQANLGNDESTIAITAAQAQPLPPDFVAASLKKTADGGYTVPVNESTVGPFLQNETDAAARKAYYVAYNNRGGTANVTLLQDAIATRDRLAHLLGYPTWAAYVLADRMASTPQRVEGFLAQIDTAILPKARQERDEDAALAKADGKTTFDQWDQTYYENQLRKTKYAVDQNEIKQYFPVQHVVDSVLGIYQELLGVKFTRASVPVWQAQVQAYDVADAASGRPLGRFYLDLFPRPGKYDHFANFPVVPRRVLPDGSVRLAECAIVGNWPQPAPGKAALLQHGDVEVFFHEFGHAMAAVLANEPYETLTNGFRQDFVEAPSQMLENWAWDPAILKRVSSNVNGGAPLPDDLIGKMIAARYVHYALQTTQQILYATVDMQYHTLKPPVDTTAVWASTVAQTTPNRYVPGTHPQSEFGHLMGGYDAGYYGYLWSKVYAQDMFSRFKAQGLTNPAAGAAYRNDILAPARLEEPDAEVRAFLGRPMNPNAFYQELGITPPAAQR
ncbi:MAG TPA: M3 family metallopeptidase [Candidatus Elarobacter sp.]|nr:M3 family metallopeptidase [Dongiaceae bacterium]HZW53916.1 M3 family metallopeptidase [Candidatus Elarobacter sp.]